jgi:hypothetical protein
MPTPAAPSGLTADVVAETSGLVRLRWTGDADGLYAIFVDGRLARRVRGTFAEVAIGSDRRTIEVVGCPDDTDATIDPDAEVPPTRAAIEWHVHSSTSADRFRVYWDAGLGVPPATLLEEVGYAGQWTLSVETPALDSGVTYAFKICSVDEAGNESAGTLLSLILRTLPMEPTGLAITFDSVSGRGDVSWT